ncbi:acyltransferase [Limosilactobacillus caecicola]|uniref:acyltransferase n=1 Tax=Limosilactobacillus caecicola TaxID=2941332 RepID=UPI00203E7AAC|nr:acyltransferase [Limosilactobacillus caecicola]
MAATKRQYLYEVDLMRCIFIFGVLANHVTSTFTGAVDPHSFAYQFLVSTHLMLHFTRMGFMFITGLVLFLGYYHKPRVNFGTFWYKRFKGAGIPYVFWNGFFILLTLILVTQNFSWSGWLSEWGSAIIHGDHFYLYYILVTMQLYLIFPLLLWLFKATEDHHGTVLVISGIIQFLFLIYVKYVFPNVSHAGWPYLMRAYGINVLSYQFYFIAGAFVSIHYRATTRWIRQHRRAIYLSTLILGLGTLGLYYYNTQLLHLDRHYANLVHQPYIMIYASLMILSIISLSLQYAAKRHEPQWQPFSRAVGLSAKLSFGVYLTQTAALSFLAGILSLLAPFVASWELLVLLPFGYLFVISGSWLISYFCYKVYPFGVLIGRPQPRQSIRKKEIHYDQINERLTNTSPEE